MTDSRPLVIGGALVLTLDDEGTAGFLDVIIEGDRIAGVAPADAVEAAFPGAARLDASGRVLMPGLINAHLHPEMHVLKGVVEERGLHVWPVSYRLNRGLEELGREGALDLQRAAIQGAFAEALLSGTTTVATYGVTLRGDEVAAEEISRFGLRGHVTIRDRSFEPARDASGQPVFPASRLEPPRMFRLHAEEALDAEELAAAAVAHARGERIVMHAAETAHRVRLFRERFGDSTVRVLRRAGLLSDRVLLSHAVHVDAEEIAIIAAAGAVVISSPSAEMKLADGVAPVADYLRAGVTVALGTDSAVCNNSTDMLRECRQLALIQKLMFGPEQAPAQQILRCATVGGAAALGLATRTGTIEAGAAADLILVDTDNPRMQPLVHRHGLSNVASNLVYAATGQDVTDVMVAGEWLVRDRCLTRIDQQRISRELARAASVVYDRIG